MFQYVPRMSQGCPRDVPGMFIPPYNCLCYSLDPFYTAIDPWKPAHAGEGQDVSHFTQEAGEGKSYTLYQSHPTGAYVKKVSKMQKLINV